jgi:hypothetical protein
MLNLAFSLFSSLDWPGNNFPKGKRSEWTSIGSPLIPCLKICEPTIEYQPGLVHIFLGVTWLYWT